MTRTRDNPILSTLALILLITSGNAFVYVQGASPPTIRIASPLDGKQFLAPITIELVADAKDADGDASVAKVEFFRDGQSLAVVRSRPFSYSWGPVSRGTYKLTAAATDDSGRVATSAPVTVFVVSSPVLPPGQRVIPESDDPRSIVSIQRLSVVALAIQEPLVVEYYTTNRSALGSVLAMGGIDYSPKRGRWVIMPGGHTTTNLDVEVFGNTSDDYDRSFEVCWFSLSDVPLASTNVVVTILDDDPPPRLVLSSLELRVAEGSRGTAPASLTLELQPPSGKVVELQVSSANGSAVAGRDYIPLNPIDNYIRFQPHQSQVTITNLVRLIDNNLNEPDRDFFIGVQVDPGFAILEPSQSRIRVTILDDDPLPTLAIRPTAASEVVEGNSGVTNAVFSVSLTPQSGRTVTVQYAATTDGNATAGADYRSVPGTLTFQPGETNKNVVVEVLGDALQEGTESFFVALSNPANAVISAAQAQGKIVDDDIGPVISIQSVTVTEGKDPTNAVFSLTLSSSSDLPVTVSFATSNQTAVAEADFSHSQGTVRFDPGITNRTIRIPILGDAIHEDSETFLVRLSAAQNATISDGEAVGTILDDDPLPTISIADVTVIEGNSGITNAVFLVTLSAPSGVPVTVNLATVDNTASAGMDYSRFEGTLAFGPGQTSRTISVSVLGDVSNEPSEVFQMRLSNPTNATIAKAEGQALIIDDDSEPVLSIDDASVIEGQGGVVNAVFVVRLFEDAGQPVTVDYATANGVAHAGSDFQAQSGTLTFNSGETIKAISVPILGDTIKEANETFSVNLVRPVNASILRGQAVGTIIDDDPPPSISIADTAITEGNSNSSRVAFIVSLSSPTSEVVTVDFSTSDVTATGVTDYEPAASGRLTFNPGETRQAITVAILGDAIPESQETFQVNLANAVNATILDGRAICTITDDDTKPEAPTITSQPKSQTVLFGNSVSLNVEATGTTPLGFQWRFKQQDIQFATNAVLSFDKATLTQSGEYSVVISNALGTVTSTSATLTVILPAPANDNISNAAKLSGYSITVESTNVNASREAAEPDHAGRPGGKSVWWTWTAPLSGKAIIETVGSTFDTLLAVYSGSAVSSLTHIVDNDDDSAAGKTSRVKLTVLEGETYLIAVDGFAGDSGSIKLTIALTDTVGPSIHIERSGNNIVISWAVSSAGFAIESTDTLNVLSTWIELKEVPVVFGNRNILKLGAANEGRFYRLKFR